MFLITDLKQILPTFPINKQQIVKAIKKAKLAKNSFLISYLHPSYFVKANRDNSYLKMLKEFDLVLPDSWLVVYLLNLLGIKQRQRLTGSKCAPEIFQTSEPKTKIFILGSEKKINQLAIEKLKHKFPKLIFRGHHGYFRPQEKKEIRKTIKQFSPNIVLLGMGSPKQEKWALSLKSKLFPATIWCVGGAIEYWAGKFKQAPLSNKIPTQWLYLLIKNPRRFAKRYLWHTIILFPVIAIKLLFSNYFFQKEK